MSDGGAEIRERLARLETSLGVVVVELGSIRTRVHEMANAMGILTAEAEESKDVHAEMARKIDRLADSTGSAAPLAAAAAATLAAHIEQYRTDKGDIRKALAEQDQERAIFHAETRGRLDGLLWKLLGWQTAVLLLCISALGYLVTHGVPWAH